MGKKINIKNEGITVSIPFEVLCQTILNLPENDKVTIMHQILRFRNMKEENPLKLLAENECKYAKNESESFIRLSKIPDIGNTADGYKRWSAKFEKEVEMFKQILADIDLTSFNPHIY